MIKLRRISATLIFPPRSSVRPRTGPYDSHLLAFFYNRIYDSGHKSNSPKSRPASVVRVGQTSSFPALCDLGGYICKNQASSQIDAPTEKYGRFEQTQGCQISGSFFSHIFSCFSIVFSCISVLNRAQSVTWNWTYDRSCRLGLSRARPSEPHNL